MINHRHFRCSLVAVLLSVCGLTTLSLGQLPPGIVTSADPSGQRGAIDAFVAAQVDKLKSADDAGAGRSALIAEAVRQGATPAFFDVYGESLNTSLLSLLSKNTDPRAHLNAGIVAARVASRAANGRLAPVALKLVQDPSDGVILWGLETAKYVVPALLASTNLADANAIGQQAVLVAQAHPTAAIVEEAYRTLLLEPLLPAQDSKNQAGISAKMLTGFLANPLALYEARVKLYDDDAPKQPLADTWATEFFEKEKVWSAETPAQQGTSLNLMVALLRGAAKQNAAAASPEMIDIIKRTGQALVVVGQQRLKKTDISTAADKLAKVTAATPPDVISADIDELDTAVKALALPATAPK